ncbi:MAG TPA: nuclear transport factor 2 family protein [Vicinamibacterales bacterium]|jgi:hypothetical protein|nr:nuclear transport factor 2 family protein [Vicinamibacterales bacterium]
MERRDFFKGMAGTAIGVGGFVNSSALLLAQVSGPASAQIGEIYQLQADYHRAKTLQDINLMMSLWDPDAVLTIQGDPGSPYIGLERVQSFYLSSGSFTNHRFSLVPSFKTQIKVTGDDAWLYFECHDVGNFDADSRLIAADAFLAGTIRRVGGRWLFWNMTGGSARPLSADHYYFP